MRTIWKFPIECNSISGDSYKIKVMMPEGAEPLCVMRQGGSGICIWAEVDPVNKKSERTFSCIGTGHGAIIPGSSKYLGSVLDEPYVWHLYVDKP